MSGCGWKTAVRGDYLPLRYSRAHGKTHLELHLFAALHSLSFNVTVDVQSSIFFHARLVKSNLLEIFHEDDDDTDMNVKKYEEGISWSMDIAMRYFSFSLHLIYCNPQCSH